ncbi:hypothetical protein GCM10010168_22900 [Actinoplanes ianthinogenes]|uniref:Uncharacterized protein n=1 Tax=Actinoplanes ianthinogenes TaxID=122358 RepID=A0ABN6CRT2_9ACTN|nr:hypothetical protein [Actinoplanes ianthinogenes]BCJ47931.1 hypothetical protein Aiant_85880 [Actinoplanes ianthinogenes]GGR05169.1 hypothetical protein GCM10010168_22900 [Actinoplanes ianthinogenes]
MTATDQDRPARLLAATVRRLPAGRAEWGQAMRAELAAVTEPGERWSFALGCLRTAAGQVHLLRGTVHLVVVLGTLGTVLAWAAAGDYPALTLVLSALVSILAAVCWQARRTGMFGPTGDSVTAWLLRSGGYLGAAVIAVVAVAHARPATLEAADDGIGVLTLTTIAASFLIGAAAVFSRRSVATGRVLLSGLGSAVVATLGWLTVVTFAPPIPPSAGWALGFAGLAAVGAVLANARATAGSLLAGLLATAATMALIFFAVVVLARWAPDNLIPDITPHALDGQHVAESRVEIVDPYVLVLVLSAIAATALSGVAVLTRVVTRR